MSLKNLKSTAQRATTLSDLMLDREQLTTTQLNGQTLTPIAVDIAAIQGKSFPVFVFSEYPDHYYNGGIILMKIVEAWLGDYEGDITALNEDLSTNTGDVRFRFREGKTKDGKNNLTTIDII